MLKIFILHHKLLDDQRVFSECILLSISMYTFNSKKIKFKETFMNMKILKLCLDLKP